LAVVKIEKIPKNRNKMVGKIIERKFFALIAILTSLWLGLSAAKF
jgi:hypothetical protein